MQYRTGVVLVVIAAILWSQQGLIFRQIDTAGSWAVLFWRSLGMLPVILAFVVWRARGRVLAAMASIGWAGVAGALGLIFAFGGAIFAIQSTTIANAVFLFSASPFLTALLAWVLLGEKVRARTWVSIGVAMVGIAVMVQGGLAGGALPGNIAALLSAAGFAVFTVSLRRSAVADPMPIVLMGGIFSVIAGAVISGATGASLIISPGDLMWSLGMGVVTLAGGMVLYTIGSRVVPAAELTLISLLEVMLAPLLVWLVLGETATRATLIGGVFVLGAVLMNATGRPRTTAVPA
jgi:drug/metabolite transporter (DMT)-like permease